MKKSKFALGLLIVIALIAWWLWPDKKADAAAAAADPGRVSREIEIEADVYSPYFGMTDAEIAAEKAKANPAIDPVMRQRIDESNEAINGYFSIDPSDMEAP